MPTVDRIHVVVDVEDDRYVGTNAPLNLTISGGGADLFEGTWTGANSLGNGDTVPRNRTGAALVASDTDGRRSLANDGGPFWRLDLWSKENYGVFEGDPNPYAVSFDTALLDPSSIRLAIRGSDLIYPRHIVVWGMADLRLANYPNTPATVRTPVPLGMALNVNRRLSTTFSEGSQSMLIPRVAPWVRAAGMGERQVDQVIVTLGLGSDRDADTSSPVTCRVVAADDRLVCSQVLVGADVLRSNEWKTWLFSATTPFTWSEIMPVPAPPQPCRLRVDGDNRLQVAHVYAFGIDSTTTPPALLPLVHSAFIDAWIGGDESTREFLLQTANHDGG